MQQTEIISLLEQFESASQKFFYLVSHEKFLDAIFVYKIDLSAYPTFNKQYTQFLESFL
jgi:hypothetical protein